MKHIRKVSAMRADAFTDFRFAVSREWNDFLFAKKQELPE